MLNVQLAFLFCDEWLEVKNKTMILEIIIGALAAAGLLFFYRNLPQKTSIKLWGNALIIAALIYVGFAVFAQNWTWLPYEIAGVGIYGLAVVLSRKFSPIWLGIGWFCHVLWDLLLHPNGYPGYVPDWYLGACLGFDLLIGGYVFWLIFNEKKSELR